MSTILTDEQCARSATRCSPRSRQPAANIEEDDEPGEVSERTRTIEGKLRAAVRLLDRAGEATS